MKKIRKIASLSTGALVAIGAVTALSASSAFADGGAFACGNYNIQRSTDIYDGAGTRVGTLFLTYDSHSDPHEACASIVSDRDDIRFPNQQMEAYLTVNGQAYEAVTSSPDGYAVSTGQINVYRNGHHDHLTAYGTIVGVNSQTLELDY